jgi:E3 ubiquitin-protein ligase synoviolin
VDFLYWTGHRYATSISIPNLRKQFLDFLKLTTYLLFFLLIVAFYGLPLNIIRDVYLTGRSFVTRLRALIRYRAATRNMDERYPDASEEEM